MIHSDRKVFKGSLQNGKCEKAILNYFFLRLFVAKDLIMSVYLKEPKNKALKEKAN